MAKSRRIEIERLKENPVCTSDSLFIEKAPYFFVASSACRKPLIPTSSCKTEFTPQTEFSLNLRDQVFEMPKPSSEPGKEGPDF